MKKMLAGLLLALALTGCAGVQKTLGALTGTTVSPQVMVIAVNSFNAIEATATNYLRLPKCGAQVSPVCRSPKATAAIIPAIRSGRAARNSITVFVREHPGALGAQGTYDALVSATNLVGTVLAQYGAK